MPASGDDAVRLVADRLAAMASPNAVTTTPIRQLRTDGNADM
jgi:hypothetical protein